MMVWVKSNAAIADGKNRRVFASRSGSRRGRVDIATQGRAKVVGRSVVSHTGIRGVIAVGAGSHRHLQCGGARGIGTVNVVIGMRIRTGERGKHRGAAATGTKHEIQRGGGLFGLRSVLIGADEVRS